ncbi:MAG TPA: DUF2254 family protein, partial [Nocardioidaceae bacterium]|nr:DUF2254 family protein [Nocardioidaceae bacterium]
MRLRLSSLMEWIRVSLFFVPVMGVLVSIVGAVVTIWIDSRLELQGADLPLGATSTVASARAVLSTVAGATISFAANRERRSDRAHPVRLVQERPDPSGRRERVRQLHIG